MEITETRIISRLYFDCGWKSIASFRCNVCSYRNEYHKKENESYDIAKSDIIQHLINKHPEYCYKCPKGCNKLFVTIGESKKCKCIKN